MNLPQKYGVRSKYLLTCEATAPASQLLVVGRHHAHVWAIQHLLALKNRHAGMKYYLYCCLYVPNCFLLLQNPAIIYVATPIKQKYVYPKENLLLLSAISCWKLLLRRPLLPACGIGFSVLSTIFQGFKITTIAFKERSLIIGDGQGGAAEIIPFIRLI